MSKLIFFGKDNGVAYESNDDLIEKVFNEIRNFPNEHAYVTITFNTSYYPFMLGDPTEYKIRAFKFTKDSSYGDGGIIEVNTPTGMQRIVKGGFYHMDYPDSYPTPNRIDCTATYSGFGTVVPSENDMFDLLKGLFEPVGETDINVAQNSLDSSITIDISYITFIPTVELVCTEPDRNVSYTLTPISNANKYIFKSPSIVFNGEYVFYIRGYDDYVWNNLSQNPVRGHITIAPPLVKLSEIINNNLGKGFSYRVTNNDSGSSIICKVNILYTDGDTDNRTFTNEYGEDFTITKPCTLEAHCELNNANGTVGLYDTIDLSATFATITANYDGVATIKTGMSTDIPLFAPTVGLYDVDGGGNPFGVKTVGDYFNILDYGIETANLQVRPILNFHLIELSPSQLIPVDLHIDGVNLYILNNNANQLAFDEVKNADTYKVTRDDVVIMEIKK